MSLSDDLKRQLLESISITGNANPSINVIIAAKEHALTLLNQSSGLPSFSKANQNKFKLILSQPALLSALNPFQIRCALCSNVISYPAWYHSATYAINHFHYFVCFDKTKPLHVTAKCFKR